MGDKSILRAAVSVVEQILDKLGESSKSDAAAGESGTPTDAKKAVALSVLRMALEHDTAKCVIENMSMLMMTHDDKALTALE